MCGRVSHTWYRKISQIILSDMCNCQTEKSSKRTQIDCLHKGLDSIPDKVHYGDHWERVLEGVETESKGAPKEWKSIKEIDHRK